MRLSSPFRSIALAGWAIALLCAFVGRAPAADDPYRVGPGDSLTVSVLGQAELSTTVTLRDGGTVRLHLLGEIEAGGKTLAEIERHIAERATEVFGVEASVIVGIAEYRDIFVMSGVERPGAYPYRPGMTVIKAIATAGGYPKPQLSESADYRLEEARRQAMRARTRIEYAEAEIKAIETELEAIEADEPAEETLEEEAGPAAAQRNRVRLRRALLERSVESSERQSSLAVEEAESFAKRRELIARQLQSIEEQLQNVEALTNRGLARREQYLDLLVEADDFRADELEATAFQARAKQTAANAESAIVLAETRYREELLADLIRARESLEVARADLRTAMAYLHRAGAEATAGLLPEEPLRLFEIYRRRGDETLKMPAELTTPLQPDDVLAITVEALTE